MNKKKASILIFLAGFVFMTFCANAQTAGQLNGFVKSMVTDQSSQAIKPLMKERLTLKIPGFRDMVNKTKACDLLDRFLTENKTKNYQLKKSGTVTNGRFVIAGFSAVKKEYIIYILFIKEEKGYYIQRIEIE